MPAAVRSQLAGCALLAALLLGGCGSGGSEGTGSSVAIVASGTGTTIAKQPHRARGKKQKAAAADPCQGQLGGFVASMDSLRRRLAVGVTFDHYQAEVRGIRSTYSKIPIEKVEIGCLGAVGTAAEQAFNRYIEAANDWGACVSKAGCSSETVEPVLQRRWQIASHFLSEADAGLNASAP